MPEFKQNIYDASLDALLSASVPREIAEAASKIVASDEAGLPNFGRTEKDQETIQEAMQHYWNGQNEQGNINGSLEEV
ncbi:hypothetical protein NIES25_48460 [Nostoc linckia NIES-25]|nr:hypothetical protein NIES25_48460 [Nostoc linckia NIES-25]